MRPLDEARTLFQGDLVDMPRPDCLRLLDISRVGRVAHNSLNGPVVVPVNGRHHDGDVYLCLRATSKLALALQSGYAAYEVDGFDDFHEAGWSVLLRGPVSWVGEDALPEYRSEWPLPWASGERDTWVRIAGAEISGRRLLP